MIILNVLRILVTNVRYLPFAQMHLSSKINAIWEGSVSALQIVKQVVRDMDGILISRDFSSTKLLSLWNPSRSELCLQMNGALTSQGTSFQKYLSVIYFVSNGAYTIQDELVFLVSGLLWVDLVYFLCKRMKNID